MPKAEPLIREKLAAGAYAEPALVPESPWLGDETPERPEATVARDGREIVVDLKLPSGEPPWLWVVRYQHGGQWRTHMAPGAQGSSRIAGAEEATEIVASAVTRLGREGPTVTATLEGE